MREHFSLQLQVEIGDSNCDSMHEEVCAAVVNAG
jgi:hypothetical protein